MSRKYQPDRVFNPIRRRIFRRGITRRENVFSAVLVVAVVLAGWWVLAQRDNFDPGERDISFEALGEGSIAELPYHTPLKRWRDPAAGVEAFGPDLGIFPATLLDGEWQVDGRVETYDPSNLYEKINGQAEQYLKFDFRLLHYVTLASDEIYLNLELYDQGRFRNALGVFASQRDPAQAVDSQGQIYFFRTSVGAVGLYESYFFKITASASDDRVHEKTSQLLEVLAGLPAETSASDAPFAVLAEGLGLGFEQIAYVRENAFQYEFFTDVWFGDLGDSGEVRVFLHRAEGDDAARALFEQLAAEQAFEHESIESGEQRALMRHRFLGTFFGAAHRGGWLYGVDGATGRDDLEAWLARIEEELS